MDDMDDMDETAERKGLFQLGHGAAPGSSMRLDECLWALSMATRAKVTYKSTSSLQPEQFHCWLEWIFL